MAHGILDLSVMELIGMTLLLTHITIASVTLFLHRAQAHRGVDFHPAINHFFRFWLWLTTATVTKEWVGVHRKHHAKSDQEDDPHSPQIFGIKKLLLEGAELYREAAKNKDDMEKYGRGTPDDWLERKVYTGRKFLGIGLMFGIDLLLFGLPGITVWAVQMIWIPVFAAGVINGLGHYRGYRNFENTDAATNISPVGILIGGEELHNNHHAFPSSARLSNKWWEFDIGWLYIKLLSFLGLAKIRRVAPVPVLDRRKARVDMDNVRSLIVNQWNVMADFTRNVAQPAVKLAAQRQTRLAAAQLQVVRDLFNRNDRLIADEDKERLAKAVKQDETLSIIYEFRQQLLAFWDRTTSNESLLADLQEWCARAEASGIKSLEDFAARLRQHSMQPA